MPMSTAAASCVRRAAAQLSRQQVSLTRSFGCSSKALQEHHRQNPNDWDDHEPEQPAGRHGNNSNRFGHDRGFDPERGPARFSSLTDFDLEEKDWSKVEDFESDLYQPTSSVMSQDEAEAFRRDNDITIVHNAEACPAPVSGFDQVNFPAGVADFFAKSGFSEPMPIQAQGWPIAMSGRDLIAIGQTGSGKTLGFLLPALAHIARAQEHSRHQ